MIFLELKNVKSGSYVYDEESQSSIFLYQPRYSDIFDIIENSQKTSKGWFPKKEDLVESVFRNALSGSDKF